MILSQGSRSFTRAPHARTPPAHPPTLGILLSVRCVVLRRVVSGVPCAFVCRRRERVDAEDIRFHEGCLRSHRFFLHLFIFNCFFSCFCFSWVVPSPAWRFTCCFVGCLSTLANTRRGCVLRHNFCRERWVYVCARFSVPPAPSGGPQTPST